MTRQDPAEVCVALFEGQPVEFTVNATRLLSTMLHDVASILDRYGKSIAPDV
jgi:hypothetical protein